jgi:hypothetical protein
VSAEEEYKEMVREREREGERERERRERQYKEINVL